MITRNTNIQRTKLKTAATRSAARERVLIHHQFYRSTPPTRLVLDFSPAFSLSLHASQRRIAKATRHWASAESSTKPSPLKPVRNSLSLNLKKKPQERL